MVIRKEILKKLRSAFSLNEYEVKIWLAILSKGVATAGELSDMGDVPRSRSYDVLESLEKKGFIVMKLGRPIKYIAVAPDEIIKRVKKQIESKAKEDSTIIDNVKKTDAFQELTMLFNQGIDHIDPANISGSFKGRNNIYNHILTMLDNAEKEVIISTTDNGLIRKYDVIKSTLRKLKQNKVKIKIAAPLTSQEAKEVAKNLKEFATVKKLDASARFVIIDSNELLFMINDEHKSTETTDLGIWVNTQFFTSSLKSMFNFLWNK